MSLVVLRPLTWALIWADSAMKKGFWTPCVGWLIFLEPGEGLQGIGRWRNGTGNIGGERELSLLQLSRKVAARTPIFFSRMISCWSSFVSVLWRTKLGCLMKDYELWFGKSDEKAPVTLLHQSIENFMLTSLAVRKTWIVDMGIIFFCSHSSELVAFAGCRTSHSCALCISPKLNYSGRTENL